MLVNMTQPPKDPNRYPAGWDAERVKRVREYYESQTDDEAVREDEAAMGVIRMGLSKSFGWLEVDRIAEALADAHPTADPLTVRFVELKRMVQALPNFQEEPGHPVNEKILEAIQSSWRGEKLDRDEED